MPVKNEVRVKNFDSPTDSWAPNKDAQTTEVKDEPNAKYDNDVATLNKGDNIDDVEKVDDNTTADISNKDVNLAAENEKKAKDEEADSENAEHDLDLEPCFTVSSAKAEGFAGSVALRVRNTGSERYWGEFPAVTFRVAVHPEDSPEGVDRLITTTTRKGDGSEYNDQDVDSRDVTVDDFGRDHNGIF